MSHNGNVAAGGSQGQALAGDAPGGYREHVATWTGRLPRKAYDKPFPRMPSDARLLKVDSDTEADARFRELRNQFRQWCRATGATAVARDVDMLGPGDAILVCEAGGQRSAALRIYLDLEATRQGRRELLIQHWFPEQIDIYLADVRAANDRVAIEMRERRERTEAQTQRSATEAAQAAAALARRRLLNSELPTPPGCKAFERQSNALRARLIAGVERDDARRHVSDLIVAYDECEGLRSPAPPDLLAVYRFNIQSMQLFLHAWDEGLDSISLLLETDRRRFDALQARFPEAAASNSRSAREVLAKTVRFALDR